MNVNKCNFFYYNLKINYIRNLFFICLLTSSFFVPGIAKATENLVKLSGSDTVYYVDKLGVRHAFPNRTTYESWFGSDFSAVKNMGQEELARLPLGNNVVMRPGKYLVKVPSSPQVYAIEPGGILRHIPDMNILEQIYGSGWLSHLRDLPEVFFGDYKIGQPINEAHAVPDGHVIKLVGQEGYFWKNNGILEPFESWSDVLANGYNKADVLSADLGLFKKLKPIKGKSNYIFNLSLTDNSSTASCETDKLTVAVIFITRDAEVSSNELDILKATINNLPNSWVLATDGLSSLEVNKELFIFRDKSEFFITQNQNKKPVLNFEEITLHFYETEADKYDFLIIYNNFLEAEQPKEKASYHLVRNDFYGTNRIILNRSRFHGSHGRLKGIINMNKINQYSVDNNDSLASLINLLHHELLHHWGASVTFTTESEERSKDLLSDDLVHWSRWVNWISPLGGWGWEKIANLEDKKVLFVSKRQNLQTNNIVKFPDIDMYLLGLLPARYMKPLQYLIPDDPSSVSNEVVGQLETVTIDQVINSQGNIKCDIK